MCLLGSDKIKSQLQPNSNKPPLPYTRDEITVTTPTIGFDSIQFWCAVEDVGTRIPYAQQVPVLYHMPIFTPS